MRTIQYAIVALACAAFVGCGNQDKEIKTETVETFEKTTTETVSPQEDKPGFFDRFRGEEPLVVVKDEEEPEASWRWFGWFRSDDEPVVEVTVPEEGWRWFGWFRSDDEPEEVIVEETKEERSWFTKR